MRGFPRLTLVLLLIAAPLVAAVPPSALAAGGGVATLVPVAQLPWEAANGVAIWEEDGRAVQYWPGEGESKLYPSWGPYQEGARFDLSTSTVSRTCCYERAITLASASVSPSRAFGAGWDGAIFSYTPSGPWRTGWVDASVIGGGVGYFADEDTEELIFFGGVYWDAGTSHVVHYEPDSRATSTGPAFPAIEGALALWSPAKDPANGCDEGCIYVFGGRGFGNEHPECVNEPDWSYQVPAEVCPASDAVYRYNPTTRVLSHAGSIPGVAYATGFWDPRPIAGCPLGCAYVFGGEKACALDLTFYFRGCTFSSEIVRFDPATGSAVVLAAFPSPRAHVAVAWNGTHAVLLGGRTGEEGAPACVYPADGLLAPVRCGYSRDVFAFDPCMGAPCELLAANPAVAENDDGSLTVWNDVDGDGEVDAGETRQRVPPSTAGTRVATLTVSAFGGMESIAVPAGTYSITASGTYWYGRYWGRADASCEAYPYSAFFERPGNLHELLMNGQTMWDGCEADHTYEKTIECPDACLWGFRIHDDNYDDNEGALTVTIDTVGEAIPGLAGVDPPEEIPVTTPGGATGVGLPGTTAPGVPGARVEHPSIGTPPTCWTPICHEPTVVEEERVETTDLPGVVVETPPIPVDLRCTSLPVCVGPFTIPPQRVRVTDDLEGPTVTTPRAEAPAICAAAGALCLPPTTVLPGSVHEVPERPPTQVTPPITISIETTGLDGVFRPGLGAGGSLSPIHLEVDVPGIGKVPVTLCGNATCPVPADPQARLSGSVTVRITIGEDVREATVPVEA